MPSLFKLDKDINLKQFAWRLYSALNMVKHAIRGGVVGAAAGYVVGEITGVSTMEAVRTGAATGIAIDTIQYMMRALFEETVTDMPRVYRNVISRLNQRPNDNQ